MFKISVPKNVLLVFRKWNQMWANLHLRRMRELGQKPIGCAKSQTTDFQTEPGSFFSESGECEAPQRVHLQTLWVLEGILRVLPAKSQMQLDVQVQGVPECGSLAAPEARQALSNLINEFSREHLAELSTISVLPKAPVRAL